MIRELVIDSFAGGGGASEGISAALGRDPDIAVNHDRAALAMHRMNHPGTHHVTEDVVMVDARKLCGGRPIGLLWMSPDCKHHSKAKGGRPRDKNIRGLAWTVLGWVKRLPMWQRPRVVCLENVEEFADWGPLNEAGNPCPLQRGATFREYVRSWQALGYVVEHRELRACDFGVPTIRKRLYWIARRDGLPIVWPEPTHGDPKSDAVRTGRLLPWVAAATVIDWSLPCPSIFETSAEIKAKWGIRAIRPLAEATMARIAKGTMRYVVNAARPFIVPVKSWGGGGNDPRDTADPLRTVTASKRGEHALVTPFVSHAQHGGRNRDAADPLHTVTASRKDQDAIVTPFVTKFNTGSVGRGVHEPLNTITSHSSDTHGGGAAPLGIVAPLLVRTAHGEVDANGKRRGQGSHDLADPIGAITASNDHAVVAPFLAPRLQEKAGHEPRVRSVEDPTATITAGDNVPGHLVAPYLVPRSGERPGQYPRTRSIEEPAPVVVPKGYALVPVEPTEAMHDAARDWSAKKYGKPIGSDASQGCWAVMLAAAAARTPKSEQNAGMER